MTKRTYKRPPRCMHNKDKGSALMAPHVQMMAFKEDVEYEAWAEDTIAKLEGAPHRAVAREAASN